MRRNRAEDGIFSINVFGVQHYIVAPLHLAEKLLGFSDGAVDFVAIRWYLLTNVFGANKKDKQAHARVQSDAHDCLTNGLLDASGASELTERSIKAIEKLIPDLISFSESLVDQSRWERMANTSLYPDSPSVEVNFFTLIRNFIGQVLVPPVFGTEFLDVYPAALDDLWDLDSGWKYLLLGLPRFLPIPALAETHIARRNLLQGLESYHEALDKVAAGEEPNQPWIELSDIGQMMKDRSAIWRAHGTPSEIKGPAELTLLWA